MNTHLIIALTIAAILIVLGAAVLVAGAIKAAGAENPVDHIEPGDLMDPEPKFTRPKDHALARQIKDSIRTKLQGKG